MAAQNRQIRRGTELFDDALRHRQDVGAERHFVGDLGAEVSRDLLAHDARVERVAGDRDAADGEHVVLREAARADLHHGEVAGAAAEVGDEDDLVVALVRPELARRGDRLGDEVDLVEAGLLGGRHQALLGEGVVAILAREARRPTEDHLVDLGRIVGVGADAHLAEDRRDEILDQHRAIVDVRPDEAPRREVLLDRAKKPPFQAVFCIFSERLLAVVAALGVRKIEDAAEDGRVARARVERDRLPDPRFKFAAVRSELLVPKSSA